MRSFNEPIDVLNKGLRRSRDVRRGLTSLLRCLNMRITPDGLAASDTISDPFLIDEDSGLGLGAIAAGYKTLDDSVIITDNGLVTTEGGGSYQAGGYNPGGIEADIPLTPALPGYGVDGGVGSDLLDVLAQHSFDAVDKWNIGTDWAAGDGVARYDPVDDTFTGEKMEDPNLTNDTPWQQFPGASWTFDDPGFSYVNTGFHIGLNEVVSNDYTGDNLTGGDKIRISITLSGVSTDAGGGAHIRISSASGGSQYIVLFEGAGSFNFINHLEVVTLDAAHSGSVHIGPGFTGFNYSSITFTKFSVAIYEPDAAGSIWQIPAELIRPLEADKVYKLSIKGTVLNTQIWVPPVIVLPIVIPPTVILPTFIPAITVEPRSAPPTTTPLYAGRNGIFNVIDQGNIPGWQLSGMRTYQGTWVGQSAGTWWREANWLTAGIAVFSARANLAVPPELTDESSLSQTLNLPAGVLAKVRFAYGFSPQFRALSPGTPQEIDLAISFGSDTQNVHLTIPFGDGSGKAFVSEWLTTGDPAVLSFATTNPVGYLGMWNVSIEAVSSDPGVTIPGYTIPGRTIPGSTTSGSTVAGSTTAGFWLDLLQVGSVSATFLVGDDSINVEIGADSVITYDEYFELSSVGDGFVTLIVPVPTDYTNDAHGGPLLELYELRLQETTLTEVP